MPALKSVLYTLTIAVIGFLAGWWARDGLTPPQPGALPAVQAAGDKPAGPVRSQVAVPTSPRLTGGDFMRMLAAGDIDLAMQLYDTLSADEPALTTRLRAAVLAALGEALARDDGQTLQELADAWLARYYDDIDVLLILAEFQRRRGYPDEAARVLQFASTYAHQPEQRLKVAVSTRTLVEKTNAALAEERRWVELLGFYQLLESIGLSQPEYRFGQALVCLELGDHAAARELLQLLTDDPALAKRAAGLLAQMDQTDTPSAPPPPQDDGIALQRSGGHYLVPVLLNDEVDATLMIDTGASITSLSQARFNELSRDSYFRYLGWRIFNTAGGHVRGNIYRANSLQLGGQVLREVDIAVLDFRQRGGVDGLLGMNVLRHYRFEIDQDRDMLYLQQR